MQDTFKIEAYDLYDYTNKVIEAAKQGYTTSTDNNKYPFNFTGYYFALLVKQSTENAQEETKTVVKGRPKKG